MSIQDAIKKTVLEKFQAGDLHTTTIAVTMGMAIVLGLFVYAVYRMNVRGGFYNRDFNKSLAALPVITAAIMLAMGSSLTISLGMVGALSIVRFRNAVKDPADLTFLFWSISVGIVVGAGLFELAVILCLVLAALMTMLNMIPSLRAPCLLVVSAERSDIEKQLMDCIRGYAKAAKIRSRNVGKKGTEWIVEMQTRNEADMVQKILEIETVNHAHLMTHDGSVRF